MKAKINHRIIAVLISLSAVLVSCVPTLEKFDSLANQGILPLSSENPHVGANLFLAHEAQRSGYLFNFLKERGGPTAIEILTESRSKPTMVLFYPLKKEVYSADLFKNEDSYQWILRGPFMMERQDYRELNGMGISFAAEPVFLIKGQSTRFGIRPIETSKRVLLPVVPTPRPTPKQKKRSVITAPVPTATPFKPLNSDQQAIAISQGFAERAENGDLIHVVKSEKETMDEIARWYTGAPANAPLLIQSNGLTPGAPLAIGSRIRVPFAAVKQFHVYEAKP